jgi:hypothetical protein
MPNWDVKQAALAESNDFMGLAIRHVNDPVASAKDQADFRDVIQRGAEALFNRYRAWETNSRNYLPGRDGQPVRYPAHE